MKVKRKIEGFDAPPSKANRFDNKSSAHKDVISPPAQQAPFSSIRSTTVSDGSTRTLASTNAWEKRQSTYLERLAMLNYQLYCIAKRALKEGVSGEGSYTHITNNYIQQVAHLKRVYCKTYGDVAVFGDGDCGQLGCGQGISAARVPRVVAGLRGMQVGAVAAGGLHTLALTENGEVYSFGCNDEGALGGEIVDEGYLPCRVGDFVPSAFGPNGGPSPRVTTFEERKREVGEATIVQIAAGETSSFALSEDGDVYMWGSYRDSEGRKFRHAPPRDDDRLATGRKDMSTLEEDEKEEWYRPPRGNQDWPLHLCLEKKAKEIGSGDGWAAALLVDESIVTWGIGTHGEMGRKVPKLDKKTSNSVILSDFLTPMPPVWNGLPSSTRKVTSIACGAYHLLASTRENGGMSVYSSGLNQYGQLGLGNLEEKHELTKIEYLEGRNITKVEAGFHFSCFVNNTGKELYCCGRRDYGQLGISLKQPDSGSYEFTPIRVPLVYTIDSSTVSDPKGNCIVEGDIVEHDQPVIEQISCGSTHVLVLTEEGDVYSWGFGESGACGHGNSDKDVFRPKKLVTKLENTQGVKFISGGGQHSAVVVATKSKG